MLPTFPILTLDPQPLETVETVPSALELAAIDSATKETIAATTRDNMRQHQARETPKSELVEEVAIQALRKLIDVSGTPGNVAQRTLIELRKHIVRLGDPRDSLTIDDSFEGITALCELLQRSN